MWRLSEDYTPYMLNKKDNTSCLLEEIKNIYVNISENGFDDIYSSSFGIDFNMELPALHDILFTISRMNNMNYK